MDINMDILGDTAVGDPLLQCGEELGLDLMPMEFDDSCFQYDNMYQTPQDNRFDPSSLDGFNGSVGHLDPSLFSADARPTATVGDGNGGNVFGTTSNAGGAPQFQQQQHPQQQQHQHAMQSFNQHDTSLGLTMSPFPPQHQQQQMQYMQHTSAMMIGNHFDGSCMMGYFPYPASFLQQQQQHQQQQRFSQPQQQQQQPLNTHPIPALNPHPYPFAAAMDAPVPPSSSASRKQRRSRPQRGNDMLMNRPTSSRRIRTTNATAPTLPQSDSAFMSNEANREDGVRRSARNVGRRRNVYTEPDSDVELEEDTQPIVPTKPSIISEKKHCSVKVTKHIKAKASLKKMAEFLVPAIKRTVEGSRPTWVVSMADLRDSFEDFLEGSPLSEEEMDRTCVVVINAPQFKKCTELARQKQRSSFDQFMIQGDDLIEFQKPDWLLISCKCSEPECKEFVSSDHTKIIGVHEFCRSHAAAEKNRVNRLNASSSPSSSSVSSPPPSTPGTC